MTKQQYEAMLRLKKRQAKSSLFKWVWYAYAAKEDFWGITNSNKIIHAKSTLEKAHLFRNIHKFQQTQ